MGEMFIPQQSARVSRRAALQTAAAAAVSAGLLADGTLPAFAAGAPGASVPTSQTPPPAWQRTHSPKPLPFAPDSLPGLSERLMVSHWQNNYGGAVNRLNQIEEQLFSLAPDAPPFLLGALKREELIATNSMILHEFYFDNLGGSGSRPQEVTDSLGAAFGDYDRWEREFRGTGVALGGGSGWVILTYSPRTGTLRNSWASDHTQNLADGAPVLVLDMYEHSYAMDYGTAAAQYISAFMDNINWQVVAQRLAEIRSHQT
jgi:superoxide dismutase, Fe-Mn family